MKRFVIGDIHGGHKALVQCLKTLKVFRRFGIPLGYHV